MKKKVFIVDDDSELLEVFKDILSEENVEVFTYDNHLNAVAEAKKENPDILLLDAQLSGVSGLDVVHQFDPKLRKILCSGSNFKNVPKGFHGVLGKPFSIEDFEKLVKSA